MPVEYGQPSPPTAPLPKDVLEAQLRDLTTREHEILALLQQGIPSAYQESEVKSELRMLREKAAKVRRLLQPAAPAVVDDEAERRRKHEAYVRQLFAEPTPEEMARRQAEAAKHRRRAIDAMVKESTEQLTWMAEKVEREGDHRSAKLFRVQIMGLREHYERIIT
jgi:hypothetical protein